MPACKDLSHLAKYANRNTPPSNANSVGCRGKTVEGNDGNLYKSVRRSDNIYTWRKVQESSSRAIVVRRPTTAPRRRKRRATATRALAVIRPVRRAVKTVHVYQSPFVTQSYYSPIELAVLRRMQNDSTRAAAERG